MTGNAPAAIAYGIERFPDAWPELKPLLELHWREIAHYLDIPLDVDEAFYRGVDAAGALRIFTVRAGGALVGYAVFFVKHNPHYQGSLQAVQDVLFLHPAFRNGSVGARLIRHADEQLRDEGVQAVYHHVKRAHNFGPLLERMGYELVDLIYARRLDR